MAKVSKQIKNTLIYWMVLYLILFVRLISRSTAFLFFKYLACLVFYLARTEREKTIRHLSIAFGDKKSGAEIRKMACQVFINLGKNGVDALRMSLINRENLHHLVQIEGIEHLKKAHEKGKGTIFLTGHIGCWEFFTTILPMQGFPLYSIGKPIYDSRLDRLIVKNREIAGAYNIARGNSTKSIMKALKENSVLGILIDQDTSVEGVFVDFLGKKAYTPIGPVVLAYKTGATIVPGAIQMMPDNTHRVLIKEAIEMERTGDKKQDLINNTQKLSDFLEDMIRLEPTQWVWMHERWKTRPEKLNEIENFNEKNRT